jgi:phage terminase small subunit
MVHLLRACGIVEAAEHDMSENETPIGELPSPTLIQALPGWRDETPAWDHLTKRQRQFVRAYIQSNGDPAQAMAVAGIDPHPCRGNDQAAILQTGRNLLKSRYVKQAIKEYWEAYHMEPAEVIGRLAQQARNDAMRYVTHDEEGIPKLDTERMVRDGNAHLIKGIRVDQKGQVVIETHDAQTALVHVGRSMQMFGDKNQTDVTVGVKRLIGVSEDEL